MRAQPSRLHLLLSGMALSGLLACSNPEKPGVLKPVTADAGAKPDAASEDAGKPVMVKPPPCDPKTNDFCEGGKDINKCEGTVYDMTATGVQVMFMIDGSSSMATHWEAVGDALVAAITHNTDISFGIHMFYAASDFAGLFTDGNICGKEENLYLDVDRKNGQNIFDTMGPQPPGTGNEYFDTSPVVQALNYYLTHDTKLANPDTTNYVVVVTDANDNCFGTFLAGKKDKNAAFAKIATELQKKHIRVLPVGFDASTGMMRWGQEVQTNHGALEALAQYGGSGLTEAFAADDPEELQQVLANVGAAVASCRYSIPAALDPKQNVNAFEIEFFVNGKLVERDRTNRQGWNFFEGNTSEVEFRGDACEAIRAGEKLEAKGSCSDEPVCGTAAGKLQTRQRAIQFALDTSASMSIPDNCIPVLDEGCLTFWGQAVNAISEALVSPVNDDAEVGLQFFPMAGIGPLDFDRYCDVAPEPEIDLAASSEVSVIQALLAQLPIGSTPLVQVVEGTADHPGRLGDPDTAGALIVISDGQQAEGCGDIDPASAAERLAAASAKLNDEYDTRVYAVKFGNSTDPAIEDQLNGLAAMGGTDMLRVAKDGEALTKVLAEISDELASCEIDIDLDAPGADKDKLNIYLNGQLVPRDETRSEGWFWVDEADKSSVELYGEHCSELKGGRLTSLVVEYGCQTVVLI